MLRIAIDGPGGAGKSTVAKLVAKELGLDYIDTGAMYRAVGYKISRDGVDMENSLELASMLKETDIDFSGGKVFLDGEDISDKIRTQEVSALASKCSAIGEVREKLVSIQKEMGRSKNVIMDGRDIGTNVLKDAEHKIFLVASPEERAQRRYKELAEKGEDVTFQQVLDDINKRDHNDTHRKLNPLRKADDAVEIDTTSKNVDEVVKMILEEIDNG